MDTAAELAEILMLVVAGRATVPNLTHRCDQLDQHWRETFEGLDQARWIAACRARDCVIAPGDDGVRARLAGDLAIVDQFESECAAAQQ